MSPSGIPFTVIGGYLGAGKTTLLNHILRNNQGRRLAVVVNDFGSINIDAELIESQDGETISLENGCICCTLSSGFYQALVWLLQREPPPEHIVVEASGVADPFEVAQYGRTPGLRLDGIIVVTDVETVRQKAKDAYVGWMFEKQLTDADVIVLNKIDLVTDVVRQAVRTWLGDLVPDAHVIEAQHGNVPLALLLGDVSRTGSPSTGRSPATASPQKPAYDTWSYASDEPLDGEAFRTLIEALPEGVIRAKGVLCLRENPEQRTIFQLVGKRWSLEPGGDWGSTQPSSRLVMIALPGSIDANWLEQSLFLVAKSESSTGEKQ